MAMEFAVERVWGPPAKLARRDSGVFEELKRLFSFTPMSRLGGDVT
jgi:hypothetical protein